MNPSKNAARVAVQAKPCLLLVQDQVADLHSARSALHALTQLVSECTGSKREYLPVPAQDLAELMSVVDAEIARCADALKSSIAAVHSAQRGQA